MPVVVTTVVVIMTYNCYLTQSVLSWLFQPMHCTVYLLVHQADIFFFPTVDKFKHKSTCFSTHIAQRLLNVCDSVTVRVPYTAPVLTHRTHITTCTHTNDTASTEKMYNTGELLAAHWLNTASGVLVEEKEKVSWRNRGVTPTLPPRLARAPRCGTFFIRSRC